MEQGYFSRVLKQMPISIQQVQNLNDELASLKSQTKDVMTFKDENNVLCNKIECLQEDLDNAIKESGKLLEDLERQQVLYSELKKMRGRAEEMDMLQQLQQVLQSLQLCQICAVDHGALKSESQFAIALYSIVTVRI